MIRFSCCHGDADELLSDLGLVKNLSSTDLRVVQAGSKPTDVRQNSGIKSALSRNVWFTLMSDSVGRYDLVTRGNRFTTERLFHTSEVTLEVILHIWFPVTGSEWVSFRLHFTCCMTVFMAFKISSGHDGGVRLVRGHLFFMICLTINILDFKPQNTSDFPVNFSSRATGFSPGNGFAAVVVVSLQYHWTAVLNKNKPKHRK